MRCNRLASEKISRIRSVVKSGSSNRIAWLQLPASEFRSASRSIPRKAFHVQDETVRRQDFLADGRFAETRNFLDGAISLVNRCVRVGERFSVGIRDGNSAEWLSADNAGLFILRPIRIVKRIVFVGVTVRPTIDGNRLNIARWIEAARPEHRAQLLTDVAFGGGERRGVQLHAPNSLL